MKQLSKKSNEIEFGAKMFILCKTGRRIYVGQSLR